MSDRERTRSRSGSAHSPAIKKEESPPNGRARGHSRSRSPVEHKNFKKSYSRSPSRSRKMSSYREERERPERSSRDERDRSERRGGERSRYRSRSRSSRSPPARKRRHVGTRENPAPSRCLGVFGLSTFTTEMQLYHIFSKYGPVESVQIVIDAKSGRSRGFGFVYFESAEDAKVAKEQCSGMEIDGRNIRVDFSITQRAHTPTPGIYMGKPTVYDRWNDRSRGRDRDDYYGGGYRSYRDRRSPSPRYRGRRYDRSRSRSYSPRRY